MIQALNATMLTWTPAVRTIQEQGQFIEEMTYEELERHETLILNTTAQVDLMENVLKGVVQQARITHSKEMKSEAKAFYSRHGFTIATGSLLLEDQLDLTHFAINFIVNMNAFQEGLQEWRSAVDVIYNQRHLIEEFSPLKLEEQEKLLSDAMSYMDKVKDLFLSLEKDALEAHSEKDVQRVYAAYAESIPILEEGNKIIKDQLDRIQLIQMRCGKGINCGINTYIGVVPLKDRQLIVGCGHTDWHVGYDPDFPSDSDMSSKENTPMQSRDHSHMGEYCIDIRPEINPDALLDVSSPIQWKYLPSGKFNKVLLEYLPNYLFEEGGAKIIFGNANRVLAPGGVIEFPNYVGFVEEGEEEDAEPFYVALTQQEDQCLEGKAMSQLSPALLYRINKKVSDFLATMGFEFPANFNMHEATNNYTAVKKEGEPSMMDP
ncbi:MAG: hypothetical protein HKM07_02695 [Chlamydiae bacterium]|nr:hypothetical protein [Chlamydiota bacterium]